ncbi:uncharacterized protein LOC118436825 [Folsomia candida]|uniref:uncharacterized protein LOC118436825 n=1 Tax=Folsomia candida TaxID=158441 RepID=UPI001604B2B8|nr:uncharacterized protein LOC118436825 [Folsomia candida]
MSASTSSSGVIPENKLKLWDIFRNVGADGEEILKTAKLAHVANNKEGFVVTMADDTYSSIRENPRAPGVCKVSKIRELSGIRVNDFFTAEINFAITEDGRLYSWASEISRDDDYGEDYVGHEQDIVNQLGRYVSSDAADKIALCCRPAPVEEGSLMRVKVRQVAFSGGITTYTVALSVGGDVHQWGSKRNLYRPICDCWTPTLIPRERFDYQEVISVTCIEHMGVALTAKGQLYQWKLRDMMSQKVLIDGSGPLKKITGSYDLIFALTDKGDMHYLEVNVMPGISYDNFQVFSQQIFEPSSTAIRNEGGAPEDKNE